MLQTLEIRKNKGDTKLSVEHTPYIAPSKKAMLFTSSPLLDTQTNTLLTTSRNPGKALAYFSLNVKELIQDLHLNILLNITDSIIKISVKYKIYNNYNNK